MPFSSRECNMSSGIKNKIIEENFGGITNKSIEILMYRSSS